MPPTIDTEAPRASAPSAEATLMGTACADASAAAQVSPDREPTSLGRYTVVRRLGAGAMGAVYEARDPDLDRPVAIKLVRGDLSERARQRMQREALALARLSHPNVVQIHEIGQSGGHTFIAMELVHGRTLERWQLQQPRPGWRTEARLARTTYAQVGEGSAADLAEVEAWITAHGQR
jgi:serine/threonine protein kinase